MVGGLTAKNAYKCKKSMIDISREDDIIFL